MIKFMNIRKTFIKANINITSVPKIGQLSKRYLNSRCTSRDNALLITIPRNWT